MALAVQGSFDDLDTPLSQVTFVVLDVETTGGSPASASLTEVAAARYRGGEMIATYQTFVRPDKRIPPYITALTGIIYEKTRMTKQVSRWVSLTYLITIASCLCRY